MSQQPLSEPLVKHRESNDVRALPVLPVRDTVLFPHAVLPLTVGRESSVQLINSLGEDKTAIRTSPGTQRQLHVLLVRGRANLVTYVRVGRRGLGQFDHVAHTTARTFRWRETSHRLIRESPKFTSINNTPSAMRAEISLPWASPNSVAIHDAMDVPG